MKPSTSEYIRVRKSSIHNKGVFAAKDVPKGAKVIEYVGDKITKAESDRRYELHLDKVGKDKNNGTVYIFELNKRHDIDGSVSWNTAKYINHSCDPNCEVEIIRGHIWILALRDINKGEELAYDYGYDWDNYDDHKCKCGAKNCAGFIVADGERHSLKKSISMKKHWKNKKAQML